MDHASKVLYITSALLAFFLHVLCDDACGGRKIFSNVTSGVITNGDEEQYQVEHHCEWLIEAQDKVILLEFESMDTECSYDHVYVYDGHSHSHLLLGAFSGSTLPHPVVATSGHMLIYFFSDRNYALTGFQARFTLQQCPFNCSYSGTCVGQTCQCHPNREGKYCQRSTCEATRCSGHGNCENSACQCEAGYTGYKCHVPYAEHNMDAPAQWHVLQPETESFPPRAGHAGVFIHSSNQLYIFGGSTLNSVLDDLMRYDLHKNFWQRIPKSLPWPSPRQHHALATVNALIYLYGGLLETGEHSNELWVYNVTSEFWTLIGQSGNIHPPGVASHTLTLVTIQNNLKYLYLFGGRTDNSQFVSDIYRIQAQNMSAQWEKVHVHYGKERTRALAAHTAVFHAQSRTILIYGGFRPKSASFVDRSGELHAFHVDKQIWTHLDTSDTTDTNVIAPAPRAHHSATIAGDYLVVFGGTTHEHHEEDTCYNNSIYLYHLSCHVWVELETLLAAAYPERQQSQQGTTIAGRYSHVGLVAKDNLLLVVGGFRGNVLGDLMAYTLPPNVATDMYKGQTNTSHCSVYEGGDVCKRDPACSWCRTDTQHVCASRSRAQEYRECDYSADNERCPGICPLLRDCVVCSTFGSDTSQSSSAPGASGDAGIAPGASGDDGTGLAPGTSEEGASEVASWDSCGWCVKEATCQRQDSLRGTCRVARDTATLVPGWWPGAGKSILVTSSDQCLSRDYPAGLHLLEYSNPPNYSQPDAVSLVREARGVWKCIKERGGPRCLYHVRMLGYLHPYRAFEELGDHHLSLTFVARSSASQLYLSTDATMENQELVSNITQRSLISEVPQRPSPGAMFPEVRPDRKYYLRAEGFTIDETEKGLEASFDIYWNFTRRTSAESRINIPYEFLEPFSSEGVACANHVTCLACLSDVSCGWCPAPSQPACVARANQNTTCVEEAESNEIMEFMLVTNPQECSVCFDSISCQQCLQNELCEWASTKAVCVRRFIFNENEAVRDVTQCPTPCLQRSDCETCITPGDECAWCETSQTCFPFFEYSLRFAFEGCKNWLDSVSKTSCQACAEHNTSAECLRHFRCGWCANQNNPLIGRCLEGEFKDAASSLSCSELIAEVHPEMSREDPAFWVYEQEPDVDECRLQLHDCHDNATCINWYPGYNCTCNQGLVGDGKIFCNKTCYHECVHGTCGGYPDYTCECASGWTGESCDLDCGCHGHSSCIQGRGICDECQHWSMGEHCELCKPGSYGNATSKQGCRECDCNGHADPTRGYCDNTANGTCFCKDNTQGHDCSMCIDGYYGDPRNSGTCYRECDERIVMANSSTGALGTHSRLSTVNRDESTYVYCVWILSVYPSLDTYLENQYISGDLIELQIETKNYSLPCHRQSVYVYDGLPRFLQLGQESLSYEVSDYRLMTSLCGNDATARPLVAKSGVMVVYYEATIEGPLSPDDRFSRGVENQGFNATYQILSCPDNCHGNRLCIDNTCVCQPGYAGEGCEIELCPGNCTGHSNHKDLDNVDEGVSNGNNGPSNVDNGPSNGDEELINSENGPSNGENGPGNGEDSLGNHDGHHNSSHSNIDDVIEKGICAEELGVCQCTSNYTGEDCGVQITTTDPALSLIFDTTRISVNDLLKSKLPRFGHTITSCNEAVAYIYGGAVWNSHTSSQEMGRGLSQENAVKLLGDIWKVDLNSLQWTLLHAGINQAPRPRYQHRTECDSEQNKLYVYGGFKIDLEGNIEVTNELWVFDLHNLQWTQIFAGEFPQAGVEFPPAMVGHTFTMTRNHEIYLIGGFVNGDYFSDKVYVYNTHSSRWSTVTRRGYFPTGVVKHSTTFDHVRNTLYVFGGMEFTIDRTIASNRVYSLNLTSGNWTLLPVTEDSPRGRYGHQMVAMGRYGHQMVSMGRYLLVLGGRQGDDALTNHVDAYDHVCHAWSSLSRHDIGLPKLELSDGIVTSEGHIYVTGSPPGSPDWKIYKLTLPERYHNVPDDVTCDVTRLSCSDHRSCGACLATSMPGYQGPVCVWCSNCSNGPAHCVNAASNDPGLVSLCPQSCDHIRTRCPESRCQASNCESCVQHEDNCLWSQYISDREEHELSLTPTGSWVCDARAPWEAAQHDALLSESYLELPCPAKCSTYDDCGDCLGNGSEHGCLWCSGLSRCIPEPYLSLVSEYGECGHVIEHSAENCPLPCHVHTNCATCQSVAGCGWCARNGTNGEGRCMGGGILSPSQGQCDQHGLQYRVDPTSNNIVVESGSHTWHYLSCAPENECENDHHDCHAPHQQCVDRLHGYECQCQPGYMLIVKEHPYTGGVHVEKLCVPVCTQECQEAHGTCTAPDVCTCQFGRVGYSCEKVCDCNMHSTCPVDDLSNCLRCQNNTQGPKCSECKPLYVGNPAKGGTCVPCFTFCHDHSQICMSRDDYGRFDINRIPMSTPEQVRRNVSKGPTTDTALCEGCVHNTQGTRCGECQNGFFRMSYHPNTAPCNPCVCHGHCDTCNRDTGIVCSVDPVQSPGGCDCHNNTKSPSPSECIEDPNVSCYEKQCSKCTDGFIGTPTHGHQCFKKMGRDKPYYFEPLYQDRTIFYAVQPLYSNVDIKLIIDVTKGGMDVWLSKFEDSFIVHTDPHTGHHDVTIDQKYVPHMRNYTYRDGELVRMRDKRSVEIDDLQLIGGEQDTRSRAKRANSEESSMNHTTYDNRTVRFIQSEASGWISHVSITESQTFLLVRNVQNRLLIILQHEMHRFQDDKMFVIIHGRGNAPSNATYGTLFFRQDHPQIDLFVFFSVFFASFFMKLAIIVLFWKIKQSIDAQRTRVQRQEQMRHMASRPFAKSLVYIELPPPTPPVPAAQQTHPPPLLTPGAEQGDSEPLLATCAEQEFIPIVKSEEGSMTSSSQKPHSAPAAMLGSGRKSGRRRRPTTPPIPSHFKAGRESNNMHHGGRDEHVLGSSGNSSVAVSGNSSLRGSMSAKRRTNSICSTLSAELFHHHGNLSSQISRWAHGNSSHTTDIPFGVNPVAFEPADDGVAGVGTVVFQLPGGKNAPVGVCFGSALITTRVMYPSLSRSTPTHIQRQGSTSV